MKRMLINATHHNEEMRVALVDGQRLFDLDIELAGREQKKGNIYKGKVTRIEPSLEAAFVDYGAERHGFLPLKEVAREYMHNPPSRGRPTIKDALKEGQEIIVQIDKEERGNKGAALTTSISLAGSYMVLMPNNSRAGGISRRIEGEERQELKSVMSQINVPKGMGCIIRTAGVGKDFDEINGDFSYLLNFWNRIKEEADKRPAPFFIYQESNVINRAIRDYLRPDIGEILVDRKEIFELAKSELAKQRPDFVRKIKLYQDEIPLFNRYQVESQIESAFQREVRLPSGGSVVFDQTEALLSIDINSARATKGSDIEETALHTNKEAAEEIARQLRLRDIGGLIVIDFIDMGPPRNQREVENVLRDSVKRDRARIQIGRISKFGLLEMSRQRLRPSLEESSQHVCPRCTGHGVIRGTDSLGLSILRLVGDEAMKESTAEVHVIAPVELATFLLNEKRRKIEQIEKQQKVRIIVVPNPHMDTPHYEVLRVKADETHQGSSYDMVDAPSQVEYVRSTNPDLAANIEKAAIQSVPEPAEQVAPKKVKNKRPVKKKPVKAQKKDGFFKRLWDKLTGNDKKKKSRQNNRNRGRNNRNNRHQGKNRNRNYNKNRHDNKQHGQKNSQQNKQQSQKQSKAADNKQHNFVDNKKQQSKQHANKGQKPHNKQTAKNTQAAKPKHPPRPERKTRAERMATVDGGVAEANKQAAAQVATNQATQQAPQPKPPVKAATKARKPKASPEELMVYKAQKSLEQSVKAVIGGADKVASNDLNPNAAKPNGVSAELTNAQPVKDVQTAKADVKETAVTAMNEAKTEQPVVETQVTAIRKPKVAKLIELSASAPAARAITSDPIPALTEMTRIEFADGEIITQNILDASVSHSSSQAAKTNID
ncbi:ribonuclease E [Kangiella sp. HZ709]|uniref:ribonuclease E n=1 Tax=Kangiella sp. HZ709 TaxID=2666328 RepID=UPI0012AF37BE|nr:ribonuclease E [Kangiella sp. HZ709]MRX26936.1 ribonuclease E [Kangiella sp. HZ709]